MFAAVEIAESLHRHNHQVVPVVGLYVGFDSWLVVCLGKLKVVCLATDEFSQFLGNTN